MQDLRSAWVQTHGDTESLCLPAAALKANIVRRLIRSQTGPLDRSLPSEPHAGGASKGTGQFTYGRVSQTQLC